MIYHSPKIFKVFGEYFMIFSRKGYRMLTAITESSPPS